MNEANIYCISGLGANEKAFERIRFPEKTQVHHIEWQQPEPKDTIEEYAQRMSYLIDTSKPFILVGLSFGGIMAQEIARFVQPEAIILISSVQNRKELPNRIKWAKYMPIYKLISVEWLTNKGLLGYTFWRNKVVGKSYPDLFKYFVFRNNEYVQWSLREIISWKPTPIDTPIYRLHGRKDLVFPSYKLKEKGPNINGGHWMILTHAADINQQLEEWILEILKTPVLP